MRTLFGHLPEVQSIRSNPSILCSSPLITVTHLLLRDMFKGIGLSILLGPPIVSALVVIGKKGGPYLVIYLRFNPLGSTHLSKVQAH